MPKSTYDRAIDRKPGAGGSTTVVSSGSASAIVHSTLLGLLVDDHTQYLKADGTRPLTGNLSVADTITIDGVDLSAHVANANAHHATATEGDGIDITGQVVAVDATVVRTSRLLTAGDGLTGGGTLAADRTFALASSVAGLGLTYTTGVLAVGAGYGIAVSSDDVALSSSVAGAGLTFTTGVIDVGAGAGLTVSANAVALTTPGTLTVITANSASGSHTHAVTSSSAPGAAAAILASDGTGLLTLPLFTATTSITTPLVTAVTNLQLSPTVDLQLYPTGDVLLGDGLTFRTDSFSTTYPIEGMIVAETAVAGQYGMAIGVIEADELRVRVFVADEVRIDRGEEVWAKSYGITTEDFTTPGSIGGTVVVTFESSPMIPGALFSTNDWLLFRTIDIDTGVVLSAVWGQVTGYTASNIVDFWLDIMPDSFFPNSIFPAIDLGTTTQDWTFTLRSGDTSYRIPAGSLGIDYGATGQSYIAFSVTDPIAAPYIRIRRWTGSDPYSPANHDDTVYIGNLGGIANASGDRGIWTQNEAGTSWAELSDDGVILRNASIALYDGATQKVNIGSSGTDFWMGVSSADKRFYWNGTTLAVTGQITVSSGSSGYANISDRPTSLSGINSTEGTKLSGIAAGATVGATWGTNLNSIPTRFGDAPGAAGLYLTSTHLGYYNGSAWKAWIASTGEFYFGGSTGAHLEWNGTKLRGLNSSSVEQWYADSTTGKLYAAAGDVWMDTDGLNIKSGTAETGFIGLQWKYTGGSEPHPIEAWLRGVHSGGTDGYLEYGGDSHRWYSTNESQALMELTTETGLTVHGAIETEGMLKCASMTTTVRDEFTPSNGMIIYNTTTAKFQGYQAGNWVNLA